MSNWSRCPICRKRHCTTKHKPGTKRYRRSGSTRAAWGSIRSTFATGSGDGGYGQLAPAPAAAGINAGFYDAPVALTGGERVA